MSISNYAENKLLNAVFVHDAFCVSGNPFVALHTGDPTDTGLAVGEITSGTVPRLAGTFSLGASGATANTTHFYFPSMPAVTITHISVWDSVTTGGGNCLWTGALTAPKIVNGGDVFEIATGDLDVTLE